MGGFSSATGTLAASAQPPVRPSLQEMRDYSTPSQSCLMPSPPSPLSSGEGAAQAGSGLSLLRAAMRRKASNRVALSILWTQPPLPGHPRVTQVCSRKKTIRIKQLISCPPYPKPQPVQAQLVNTVIINHNHKNQLPFVLIFSPDLIMS